MPADTVLAQTLSEAHVMAHADAAMARGQHDEALRLWSEARTRFPAAPWPWLRAAGVIVELRRFGEADTMLDEAVSRFPDNFWLLRTRALAARAQGDDVEAYTRCRALRQAFPGNPTAHTDFAHLLLDLKQVAAAEAEATASLALFPDHKWLRHMHARCADQTGDCATAASRWIDLLVRHPDHEPAYAPAVRALIRAGRLEEATGIASEGLSLFPNGNSAREGWAAVGEAADTDKHAVLATESPGVLLAGALRAERKAMWPGAARLWALLRARTPSLTLAYANGARALLHLNRGAEAEIVLEKARRHLPPDADVLEAWADAAVQRNSFDDALARFRALRQAFATAPRADLGIARALHALGRLDEADAAYARLSDAQPSNICVAQQYALIATERCDWPEAIRRWTRMTAEFPDHLPAYWHEADALTQAGRAEEADAVLSNAVSRFPTDLETALRWAMSAHQDTEQEYSATRSAVLCQRFPGVAVAVNRSSGCAEPALVAATSQ